MKKSQYVYPELNPMSCDKCGVEIDKKMHTQHADSIPCVAMALAKQAGRDGYVKCEEAMFVLLCSVTPLDHPSALVSKLKTGIETSNQFQRKLVAYNAIEELWADRVAVEMIRQMQWSMEARLQAVRRYAAWKQHNATEAVDVGGAPTGKVDPWTTNGVAIGESLGVAFGRNRVSYDGITRTSSGTYSG